MKIYIIVEGEQIEMTLYPSWFSFLLPKLKKVENFKSIETNSYYLFCGQGIPSIYKHVANAILDINTRTDYDYLLVCLDGENLVAAHRKQKLLEYLDAAKIELLGKCKMRIVVQNRCIETWFLGNRKIIKSNPENEILRQFLQFYDVQVGDPEAMPLMDPYKLHSQFHEAYLREVFKERKLSYRKSRPKEVLAQSYFDEIFKRTQDDAEHLLSFQEFLSFVNEVGGQIAVGETTC